MTALDKYGHTYIYKEGLTTSIRLAGTTPAISYYFVENDGWTVKNNGLDTKVDITFDEGITSSDIEKIVASTKIDDDAKRIILDMTKHNKVQSGRYDIKTGRKEN